jgi:hypothetical protein
MVSGNDAKDNWLVGIFLDPGCDGNEITQNVVCHNGVGVLLNANSGNLIYYNRLVFNIIDNAIDNGTSNSWDNGTAGNHWDDYTGFDADGDGIGETWYAVPGSATAYDRKPLANTIPRFSSAAVDLTYEIGTTGHQLSWLVVDTTPWLFSYVVSLDEHVLLSVNIHDSFANITFNVDARGSGWLRWQKQR